MLAKNKEIVKKYKSYARKLIKKIVQEKKFIIEKRIKFGPRYFVAQGKYNDVKAIFKICLYPKSYDHLTNEKFSREILFLNIIKNSSYLNLRKSIPLVYESAIDARAWYIREFLDGQVQNINNGNIRYNDKFFTLASFNWFKKTFTELHKIKSNELPSDFKKLLFSPQTLEYMWRFISPFGHTLDKFVKHKGMTKKIHAEFNKYSHIYKQAPHVLAHQEVYSPHILNQNKQCKLIDWENIGWALPTHDIVTMWMRAYKHPVWQNNLKKYFFNKNKKIKHLDILWNITVLLQSTFNVISYPYYFDKKDFYPLAEYSAQMIKKLLK